MYVYILIVSLAGLAEIWETTKLKVINEQIGNISTKNWA